MLRKEKTLKVLFINHDSSHPEFGYGGRHYYLGEILSRNDVEVKLVAASWHHLLNPKVDKQIPRSVNKSFDFYAMWTNRYKSSHGKGRILSWVIFMLQLLRLPFVLKNWKPDVVVYSSPQLFAVISSIILAKFWSARFVFEVRDIWPLTLNQLGAISQRSLVYRFLGAIEKLAYYKSDLIISNLAGFEDYFSSNFGFKREILIIPNGASTVEHEESLLTKSKLTEYISESDFVVVYAGALGHANNLQNLLKAAVVLKDSNDIKFILVGKGLYENALKEYCRHNNLTNVIFWGYEQKRNIPTILKECDVCYLGLLDAPLFQYGVSPNKLYDYLCAGKPIISCMNVGNHEILKKNNCGVTLKPDDSESLARELLEMYKARNSGSPKMQQMGTNARNLLENQYNYESLAKKLKGALLEVAKRH